MAENDVALALLRNELPVPGTAMTPAPEPNLGDHLRYIDYLMGKKVEDMGSAIARALMAPGNALRGEYDQVGLMGNGAVTMADPRMYDDAAELAGLIGLGAMPMPRPTNSLGMFGGMNAKTADLDALKRAQTLEATGAPREAIWNDTGWFKGADGQWRFEIDDSVAVSQGRSQAVGKATEGDFPLWQVMRHPQVYQAYPDLSSRPVTLSSPALGGQYKAGYHNENDIFHLGRGASMRDDDFSLGHEVQHAIQAREGFAGGGNLGSVMPDGYAGLAAQADELSKAGAWSGFDAWRNSPDIRRKALNWTHRDTVQRYMELFPDDALFRQIQEIDAAKAQMAAQGAENYKSLAGEVEARNVQTRMNMTPEQRKAQAPWLTQDVPDNLQIIRRMLTMKGPDK